MLILIPLTYQVKMLFGLLPTFWIVTLSIGVLGMCSDYGKLHVFKAVVPCLIVQVVLCVGLCFAYEMSGGGSMGNALDRLFDTGSIILGGIAVVLGCMVGAVRKSAKNGLTECAFVFVLITLCYPLTSLLAGRFVPHINERLCLVLFLAAALLWLCAKTAAKGIDFSGISGAVLLYAGMIAILYVCFIRQSNGDIGVFAAALSLKLMTVLYALGAAGAAVLGQKMYKKSK